MAELRRLTASDSASWLAMRSALWPQTARESLAEDIPQMLADARQPAFGIFIEDRLVAFAEASERDWGNGCLTGPVAWLEAIYVDPAHRHTGLATRLVAAVTAWAKSRGITELGSDVAVDNAASLRSHQRWGFFETERLVVLRKDI